MRFAAALVQYGNFRVAAHREHLLRFAAAFVVDSVPVGRRERRTRFWLPPDSSGIDSFFNPNLRRRRFGRRLRRLGPVRPAEVKTESGAEHIPPRLIDLDHDRRLTDAAHDVPVALPPDLRNLTSLDRVPRDMEGSVESSMCLLPVDAQAGADQLTPGAIFRQLRRRLDDALVAPAVTVQRFHCDAVGRGGFEVGERGARDSRFSARPEVVVPRSVLARSHSMRSLRCGVGR